VFAANPPIEIPTTARHANSWGSGLPASTAATTWYVVSSPERGARGVSVAVVELAVGDRGEERRVLPGAPRHDAHVPALGPGGQARGLVRQRQLERAVRPCPLGAELDGGAERDVALGHDVAGARDRHVVRGERGVLLCGDRSAAEIAVGGHGDRATRDQGTARLARADDLGRGRIVTAGERGDREEEEADPPGCQRLHRCVRPAYTQAGETPP
jgi:hypothetical protein